MLKNLYYVQTNGYDMVVSVSVNDKYDVMYATDLTDIPFLARYETGEKEKMAEEYLKAIEDDSSWECADDNGITLDELLYSFDNEVLAHIAKEI